MNKALKLVVSAALAVGTLTVVSTLPACGGGGGGTGGGSAAGGGSGGGSGGGGGGGSTADAGLNCTAYCTSIMANCTGANAQFSQMDRCVNACKTFAAGAVTDTSGNTLGCRIYHAGAAHMDPVTHCVHAGPGGAGVCGADCDGYCQLTQAYCTTANSAFVYPDSSTCKTHCMKLGTTVKFSVADDAGTQDSNQVACLLYHAQEATTDPMEHCLGDLANDGGNSTVTCVP